jgi:glutamate/tyrosine decarboxylase-like PLP-dependent enzyme
MNPCTPIAPLLTDASARAIRYLDGLDSRSVMPTASAVAGLKAFDERLPDNPSAPAATLKLLDEVGSPATTAMAGRRFFDFVTGGSLPVALAANWLASAWDQNTRFYQSAPVTSYLEQIALRWLLDLFHLPIDCAGAFVTGATAANFCALAAARYKVLKNAEWDIEGQGLFGAPPITVIVGQEVHPSVTKSLGLLGLGRNRIVRVPVDGEGRIRADCLPAMSGPTIICVQAGNVNTGAFDPIDAIRRQADNAGAWLHVDGAFGLWAVAAPSRQSLVGDISKADSWATDAHKWLNVPYDCGLAFVRDSNALKAAMSVSTEYFPTQTEFRDPSDFTPELSRRARGVEVWAALRSLGRQGIAEIIERNCAQARRFAEKLSTAGFEILNHVVLNQVLVSFGNNENTSRIVQAVQDEGSCRCGLTVWQGKPAMRISVCSWATTNTDVDRSVSVITKIAMR